MERIEIQIARKFHKVYEKLAPEFGYTTRPETREFDENSSNGKLMIAVCKEVVLEELDRAREEIRKNIWAEVLFNMQDKCWSYDKQYLMGKLIISKELLDEDTNHVKLHKEVFCGKP